MTGWDIDPGGVSGVLSKAGTAAKNMSDAGGSMQTNLEGASSHAGTLTSQYGPYTSTAGVVGAALAQFAQHWNHDLVYIAKRTSKSLNGAAEATRDYLNGSLEQAANAQQEAAKEPQIDLPGQGQGRGRGETGRRTEGQ
ncbi:DUF6507 family protein [Streptomyces sp. NPDC050095]|uniref:DUF6507 family protein n=1 Tax=unclassified Streptomyces TaxID=2593676 RepID=UPI0034459936